MVFPASFLASHPVLVCPSDSGSGLLQGICPLSFLLFTLVLHVHLPIPRLRIKIDFLAEERSEISLAYADGRDEQCTAVIRPRPDVLEGAGRKERGKGQG